ncbi:putative E3 ubiquitin-protein ligase LIN-1 isoform X1 [Nicotiana tomentosiformis]|uniref:putative E3 ubiquitin-protein ligase LIN-1 isoform X1 n=2 Tax=Nicotiana tomentosiformis TaxID=4098 RepID=UPI00051C0F53|nr:putative E3 ubiquitin-protein ligase LIN-1 isoform X1 [Nicotiana tomentosiformis]
MAGNYRFEMDQEDIVRSLITAVGSFIQDRLIDKEQRTLHKEQCAERLAAEDGNSDKDTEVRYSDQAVLANLDWGIDALEEAINTSNIETKMARLDYAEKMLQVCAMLDSNQKTAGVPNFYLSAWAHLNLSYLWKLRNNVHNAVLHILEMFTVDPFFSRIDFAPELWKSLFVPHMSSIVGWYSEERHRIVMDVIPDSSDLSFTMDFDHDFNESLIFSVRPDQAEKMQKVEQLYGQSLDENTRLYAKYYKDCMNYDSATSKKAIPLLPIAEPPMTPLHEVCRSIPDYVKFGPILPKSAGFTPILRVKENANGASRLKMASSSSENQEDSTTWDPLKGIPEVDEEDYDPEPHVYTTSNKRNQENNSSYCSGVNKDVEARSKVKQINTNQRQSPKSFPSMDFPKLESPKAPSPKGSDTPSKKGVPVLRLLSGRVKDTSSSISLHSSQELKISSADSDEERTEQHETVRKRNAQRRSLSQSIEKGSPIYSDEGSHSCISLPLSDKSTAPSRPPKDFVCPITGQIFNDPVTLETGQTYERKAIQEWMNRGNTTCPITRQSLSASTLPKANYVLKRLITSWREQHPDLAQDFSYSETPRSYLSIPSSRERSSESTPSPTFNHPNHRRIEEIMEQRSRRFMRAAVSMSPTSVISQAATEAIINGLKPYVSCLCTSEDLQECEQAILTIAKIWGDSKLESQGVHSYLSAPTIVNGFVEVLSASQKREVLRTTIYILSELLYAEDSVGEILTSVDSDFECLATLLKDGLAEAAVLIYLLRPSFSQLSAHNFVPSLTQIISNRSEDSGDFQFTIGPKDASVVLLEQIITGGGESDQSFNAMQIISGNGILALLKCLEHENGRESIVCILLCCIRADTSCRNTVASRIELSPVLELIHTGSDSVKATCIELLYELVLLSRRTLCNQILQIIKDEGAFSTMHTLLVSLQMASVEQKSTIAPLLLQLDLLVEPRKMSIYREESIEALIEALHKKDFPASQLRALDALLSLSGHLTNSGKSFLEARLLKIAGFNQRYNATMKEERQKAGENDTTNIMEEEEKALSSWENRTAFVLCNHEKGLVFRALEECLKSTSMEIAKSSFIVATWLIHMLYNFPDTGIRDVARKSLLEQFIQMLQSTKNIEEKILAALALRGFITDLGALSELGIYAKCLCKSLRKLKKYSVVVSDIMKTLMNLPCIDAAELWCYSECPEVDVSMNGEVLCLLHIRGRLISSHSDGTIKVWETGKRAPRLIHETREHTKAVTCLYVSSSYEKLYSGSLDRTIRVWAINQEEIHCLQVHDVKEPVLELIANTHFACFASQATGVKVYTWSGVPKHVNFQKYVKCLAIMGDKLYCGCTGYSIQEVDLSSQTSTAFYAGAKKLLGKQNIYSLQIQKNVVFAGGSLVDGISGKVFSLPSKAVIGSLSTCSDIQRLAVNNDFIFSATKSGTIEVWLQERVTKITSIKMKSGGQTKITSLAVDKDGEMIFAGSTDGKIQAWRLD